MIAANAPDSLAVASSVRNVSRQGKSMSRKSRRQLLLSKAAETHEEHKHIIEFLLLVSADFAVRLLTEPDHVKHSLGVIISSIFGQ